MDCVDLYILRLILILGLSPSSNPSNLTVVVGVAASVVIYILVVALIGSVIYHICTKKKFIPVNPSTSNFELLNSTQEPNNPLQTTTSFISAMESSFVNPDPAMK